MVLASAGLATLAVVVWLVNGLFTLGAFSRPNHGASETKCNTGSVTELVQASNERDRTKYPETPQKACTRLKATSQKS
jgi:hypothetical protein